MEFRWENDIVCWVVLVTIHCCSDVEDSQNGLQNATHCLSISGGCYRAEYDEGTLYGCLWENEIDSDFCFEKVSC
jgi:hypothetical protein